MLQNASLFGNKIITVGLLKTEQDGWRTSESLVSLDHWKRQRHRQDTSKDSFYKQHVRQGASRAAALDSHQPGLNRSYSDVAVSEMSLPL